MVTENKTLQGTDIDAFDSVVKPAMEYLKEYCIPNTKMIITSRGVRFEGTNRSKIIKKKYI